MVKAVIFDLDDTLISEKNYIESGYLHISTLLSNRMNKDQQELNQILHELFNETPKNVFNRLFDKLEVIYTNNNIIELVEEYRTHLPTIHFFDDVIPCLEDLKKNRIKTGTITDGFANSQRQKLKAVKAIDYFDEIIITDELGREYWKPHPKAFEIMKEALNVEFSDMVYVGDNISKDFVTPNRLGMKTVCIYREKRIYKMKKCLYPQEFHAQYTIKTLYDLLVLLKQKRI